MCSLSVKSKQFCSVLTACAPECVLSHRMDKEHNMSSVGVRGEVPRADISPGKREQCFQPGWNELICHCQFLIVFCVVLLIFLIGHGLKRAVLLWVACIPRLWLCLCRLTGRQAGDMLHEHTRNLHASLALRGEMSSVLDRQQTVMKGHIPFS